MHVIAKTILPILRDSIRGNAIIHDPVIAKTEGQAHAETRAARGGIRSLVYLRHCSHTKTKLLFVCNSPSQYN